MDLVNAADLAASKKITIECTVVKSAIHIGNE